MLRADAPPFVPISLQQHQETVDCINARQTGIQKKSRRRGRRKHCNSPKQVIARDDKYQKLDRLQTKTNDDGTVLPSWASVALKGHTDRIKAERALIKKQAERLNGSAKSHITTLHRLGGKSQEIIVDQKDTENRTLDKNDFVPLPPVNRYFKKHSSNTATFLSRWLSLKVELEEREKVVLETSTASTTSGQYDDHEEDLSPPPYGLHDEVSSHWHDRMPSQHPYPLHDAILRNDEPLFKSLLSYNQSQTAMPSEDLVLSSRVKTLMKKYGIFNVSPIQLCVISNRSQFLRHLLEHSLDHLNDDSTLPPVFLASMIASNDCLMSILNVAGPSVLFMRHSDHGDTAFHVACKTDQLFAVQSILSFIHGRALNNGKLFQRLLSCQNDHGETPLHLACAYSRTQIIEVILSSCTTSCGAKILRIKDKDDKTPLLTAISRGSSDAVIHLLMWRGNHRESKALRVESSDKMYCPLTFAAWSGSIDMISTLLEYGNPSINKVDHEYNIQQALHQTMFSFLPSKYRQVICILVKAGANPYNFSSPKPLAHPLNHEIIVNQSPLLAAIQHGKYDFIDILLDEYFTNLETIRRTRRQDSALFKQPANYFTLLESKENDILNDSLQDGLVKSLLLAWRCMKQEPCNEISPKAWYHLQSSLSIVRRSHSVSISSIVRLYLDEVGRMPSFTSTFSYEHPCIDHTTLQSIKSVSLYDRSGAKGWSMVLYENEWFREMSNNTYCAWLKLYQQEENCNRIGEWDRFKIVCNNEVTLTAHRSIVSQKSEKIKAAIHFSETISAESQTTIRLDKSSNILTLFLSHCYHGSIFCGLSTDFDICTKQLLELYVLAEEYMCPTLVRECEFRLMSECPYKCYCWYCCSEIFSRERKDSVLCSNICDTLHTAPVLNTNVILSLFSSMALDSPLGGHSTEFKNFVARMFLLNLDRILRSEYFLDYVSEIAQRNSEHAINAGQVGALLLRECLIQLFSTAVYQRSESEYLLSIDTRKEYPS